jgi:error-prone DNA polymerase
MSKAVYTELHARSAFSFLEGAALPEELAGKKKKKGMDAMAALDARWLAHRALSGCERFNSGAHWRGGDVDGLAVSVAMASRGLSPAG